MNPRPRTLTVIAVGVALLVQTWLWIGVIDPPLGYAVEGLVRTPETEFLLGGVAGELGSAGGMRIQFSPSHLEQDWPLVSGGAIHISEDVGRYSLLLEQAPRYDELLAALKTRANWQETTALSGRVNALRTKIGRLSISIEGPVSHDDLFRIAESLRPGFAPLL